MTYNQARGPVRLVLFDIFGTLVIPRLPIHDQYYEEAIKAGISPDQISPQSIWKGFIPAFKTMDSQYPLYGKLSKPPITPGEWWTNLIRICVTEAGADQLDVERILPVLGPALLERFESNRGYRLFEDTLDCLKDLRELGVKTSIVSNADPRILKTLESHSILPLLTYPPILSWDVEISKPDKGIYELACKSCNEPLGEGVIMIGDELEADYHGAKRAGLEVRLLRRPEEWTDAAEKQAKEDLSDVEVIKGFKELVEEVRQRNLSN